MPLVTASLRDSAIPTASRRVAIIGCGVIGLTTARTLQRRGTRSLSTPKKSALDITSSKATGTWSPAHSLIDTDQVTASFSDQFERMHQTAFRTYQNMLGYGDYVVWNDSYDVRQQQGVGHYGDLPDDERHAFMNVLPQPVRLSPRSILWRLPAYRCTRWCSTSRRC